MESELKTLYELIHPYGDYDGNISNACISVERVLKKLCRENYRHVLLIIGRALGRKYESSDSTSYIC